MTVTSAGFVGVGITTPSSILDICDSTGSQKNVTLSLRNGNFGWWSITSSNSNTSGFLRFASQNSGQTPLTLDGATGSVGISNNTPTAKLDIADTTLAGSGSLAGSILNLAQTWNTTGAPTAIKLNVTNTASGAASNLLDLQVDTVSKFKVEKTGNIIFSSASAYNNAIHIGSYGLGIGSASYVAFSSSTNGAGSSDLFISRKGTANLLLGFADAAAPIAQTLSVQSVVAGTTNTAGANLTITGSQGTGTGTGGSIIFQTAQAGSSGSTQNALSAALTIDSNRNMTIGGPWNDFTFNVPAGGGSRSFSIKDGSTTTFQVGTNGMVVLGYLAMGASTPSPDVLLQRDAANTLGLRNGVNPQTFRLYNTYTDATTFERLNIKWDTNVLKLGTEKGASGGTARAMELQTDGATRMTISSDGNVGIGTTTPTNPLHVYGATADQGIILNNVSNPRFSILRAGTERLRFNAVGNIGTISAPNGNGLALGGVADASHLVINSSGNIGIGTIAPTEKLDVAGNLKVSGHFSATTKSFLIPHPTKPDKKLQYACLEGPENGVYIRGKTNEPIILLPDYWSELVDADSITVTVTPIGKPQQLFVVSQNSTSVEIGNVDGLYNYLIFAERKDVNKLQTEI